MLKIVKNGNLNSNYNEAETSDYMKNDNIEIHVDILSGSKNLPPTQWTLQKNILKLMQIIEHKIVSDIETK